MLPGLQEILADDDAWDDGDDTVVDDADDQDDAGDEAWEWINSDEEGFSWN